MLYELSVGLDSNVCFYCFHLYFISRFIHNFSKSTIVSTTNTSICQVNVIPGHRKPQTALRHAKQLHGCGGFLKYIINLRLLLSLRLCFLIFFQYILGDGMVIFWYAIFPTTFFVYSIMTAYVSSTCKIPASIESGSLSTLQIFFSLFFRKYFYLNVVKGLY